MTLMDKLEIGLKEDAPYRKDNLPPSQVRGPELPAGPGRSPVIPAARGDHLGVQGPAAPKAAVKKPRAAPRRRSSPATRTA